MPLTSSSSNEPMSNASAALTSPRGGIRGGSNYENIHSNKFGNQEQIIIFNKTNFPVEMQEQMLKSRILQRMLNIFTTNEGKRLANANVPKTQ